VGRAGELTLISRLSDLKIAPSEIAMAVIASTSPNHPILLCLRQRKKASISRGLIDFTTI